MAPNLRVGESMELPDEIMAWARDIFSEINRRLAEKIRNVPGIHESHLDTTLIEHLTTFASPRKMSSGWAARIETHYLGGLHQFRRWEIADIGVFVFFQQKGKMARKKVALLQSKRLYPTVGDVEHIELYDYYVGMPRLAIRDEPLSSLLTKRTFSFDDGSRYQALKAHDNQHENIKEFLKTGENPVPVYYLLYNPPNLPFSVSIPVETLARQDGAPEFGARVLPSANVFSLLDSAESGYSPSVVDLRNAEAQRDPTSTSYGWRLEYFIVDLLLGCKEGRIWDDPHERELERIFNRKSGPISAAISITIEVPADVEIS